VFRDGYNWDCDYLYHYLLSLFLLKLANSDSSY